MKYHFCTSFDNRKFLLRGLVLYRSLIEQGVDFYLWVLCMEQESYDFLEKLNLTHLGLVHVKEFETKQLLKVKKERTLREYSITCKSFFISYMLETRNEIDLITWLDADLYFFDSPDIIYREFGNKSIGITEHNYFSNRKKLEDFSGKYNAGFIIFRRDTDGLACLSRWKRQCLEWCYGYHENRKFGEQMYLNEWPHAFTSTYVFSNRGANAAYWNYERYRFFQKDGRVWLIERETRYQFPLVFYHFSGITLYEVAGDVRYLYNRRYLLPHVVRFVYKPYGNGLSWALWFVRKHSNLHWIDGMKNISVLEFIWKNLLKWLLSHIHAPLDRMRDISKDTSNN